MTDPTPTTPITIRDQMIMFLSTLQGTPAKTLEDIWTELQTIRGTPAKTLYQIWLELTTLNASFAYGEGITPYNLLDNIYTKLVDTNDRLDKLQAAIGAVPYGDLELVTVRGLLYALLNSSLQYGVLPDGTDQGTASVSSISADGRRYIVWPNLPNITESSDGMTLTPPSTWAGYQVYIKTDAPDAILHDATDPNMNVDPFPVNSWVSLAGNHNFKWSVPSSYDVTGYMRIPVPPTNYVWTGSSEFELRAIASVGNRYQPLNTKYTDISLIDTDSRVVLRKLSGWTGWQWSVTSYSGHSLAGRTTTTGGFSSLGSATSGTVGLSGGNAYVDLSFSNISAPSGASSFSLTAPA